MEQQHLAVEPEHSRCLERTVAAVVAAPVHPVVTQDALECCWRMRQSTIS